MQIGIRCVSFDTPCPALSTYPMKTPNQKNFCPILNEFCLQTIIVYLANNDIPEVI
uniref:Uncharacterized protein n=1 Tax=Anguilla anguilla TaxID=7936 RepID=A0A0E9TIZ7_ANGAN